LPSSMHTPWAGSNRYKISELMSFIAERLPSVDSPSLPFCIRFNVPLRRRRQHYGFTASYRLAATLDTEPLAKSDSGGNRTRLSSNHLQSARATLCYAVPVVHSNSLTRIYCTVTSSGFPCKMRSVLPESLEKPMISENTRSVIERAKVVYEAHRADWERSHLGEFVSIEPVSGEWFFAESFDASVRSARLKFPDRISYTIRVGYGATIFIGNMES
jgi:hypothetical protein